jgi:hypothetical protein
MFWFRFQNDIGMFVLSFLTFLPGGPAGAAPAIHQPPPLPPRLNPRYVLFEAVLWMLVRADPDPAFYLNADPGPHLGKTKPMRIRIRILVKF